MRNPVILCFGEVLWDLLPSGKKAGGAPMNVAYHVNNLGMRALMISRVGNDALGAELREFLESKGVATAFLQTDSEYPTGVVNVSLDGNGIPSYEIVQPAAWDYIAVNAPMLEAAGVADAMVFGSLACRNERSRETLLELIERARMRVFDVNLRSPFYTPELLEGLLPKADTVKVNDIELDILCDWYGIRGEANEKMQYLRDKFGLKRLIVTMGEKGAACLSAEGLFHTPGLSIQVQDTIGSGDAFLAGFLSRSLAGQSDEECLRFANAMGALVATKAGGTPQVSGEEIQAFIAEH